MGNKNKRGYCQEYVVQRSEPHDPDIKCTKALKMKMKMKDKNRISEEINTEIDCVVVTL